MIVVPAGAEMILAMRSEARSTSGSQSLHAEIDLVRHSSKNSARSSLAWAGTQPSECEMKWTHSSRAGNALRCSSRLSATGSAMAWLTTDGAGPRRPRGAHRAARAPSEKRAHARRTHAPCGGRAQRRGAGLAGPGATGAEGGEAVGAGLAGRVGAGLAGAGLAGAGLAGAGLAGAGLAGAGLAGAGLAGAGL